MGVLERFREQYGYYKLSQEAAKGEPTKLDWVGSDVFGFVTYDDEKDEDFAIVMLEVCGVILRNENYEYINDEENYLLYLLACQWLCHLHWIDWGTSIRGAYFETNEHSRPMLYDNYGEVPFSEENLRILIDFVLEEEK